MTTGLLQKDQFTLLSSVIQTCFVIYPLIFNIGLRNFRNMKFVLLLFNVQLCT